MDEKLICLLRRPTELAVLVSRRLREFVRPRPVFEDAAELPAAIGPYREAVRPPADHDLGGSGVLDGVKASWETLGQVTAFDAHTLFHVLHVLVYTLPDGETVDAPPLKIEHWPKS